MGKTLKTYADHVINEAMIDYNFYRNMYHRMVCSMFRWHGLPDTISERFIELTLYDEGKLAIYKHRGGFLAAARIVSEEAWNDNEEPTVIRIDLGNHAKTKRTEILYAGNFVIIRNDILGKSSRLATMHYAKRLEGIDKTMGVNLEQLKQPTIIVCPEGQLQTAKQLWAKKESGEPVILVDEDAVSNLDINPAALDLKVSNHLPDLYETKHQEVNESMTYFGVNNVNVIKRERLVSGETEQNDEQIFYNSESMLYPRKKACEEVNKLFGQNWSVEKIKPEVKTEVEEGEDNG